MGVHNLWELLAPVGRRVSVEALGNKKLAIDASIWIVQFMKAMRDDRGDMIRNAHLLGFFRRICKLLFLRVKPVFVFDGATPALKRRTVIARRRQQENARAKIRKTAEKLLLNHIRTRHLEEASAEASELLGKDETLAMGKGEEPKDEQPIMTCEDVFETATDSNISGQIAHPPTSSGNAASPTELGSVVGTAPPADLQGIEVPLDIIDEDNDDSEELLMLPFVQKQLDPNVLASLPPSMQLDLLVQMREQLVADNRQRFQRVAKAPASFSELQIEAYLKTVAFRREINEVQQAASGRLVGGVPSTRIASETSREYIFSSAFSGEKQRLELAGSGEQNDLASVNDPHKMPFVYSSSMRAKLRSQDYFDSTTGECSTSGTKPVNRMAASSDHVLSQDHASRLVVDVQSSTVRIDQGDQMQENGSEKARKGKVVLTGVDEERHGSPVVHPAEPCNLTVSFIDEGVTVVREDELFEELVSARPIFVDSQERQVDNNHLPESHMDWEAVVPDTGLQLRTDADVDGYEVEWEDGTEDTLSEHVTQLLGDNDENPPESHLDSEAALRDRGFQVSVDANSNSWEIQWEDGMEGMLSGDVRRCSTPDGNNLCPFPSHDGEESVGGGATRSMSCHPDERLHQLDRSGKVADGEDKYLVTRKPNSLCGRDVSPLAAPYSTVTDSHSISSLEQGLQPQQHCITNTPTAPSLTGTALSQHVATALQLLEDSFSCLVSHGHTRGQSTEAEMLDENYVISSRSLCQQAAGDNSDVFQLASAEPVQTTATPDFEHAARKYTVGATVQDSEGDGDQGQRTAEKQESWGKGNLDCKRQKLAIDKEALMEEQLEVAHQIVGESNDVLLSGSDLPNVTGAGNDLGNIVSGHERRASSTPVNGYGREEDQQQRGSQQEEFPGEQPNVNSTRQNMAADMEALMQERLELREAQQINERNADSVTGEMFAECQELLQMFGLPYIIAPMEAEAQCAYMDLAGLVDGVVTNDSDVFLFGGKNVYKNLFDDRKYVETYHMKDIDSDLGLTREKLIRMALLLGSDYTEGVSGIGIVNAIEVVNAFPGEEGLQLFKDWIESPDASLLKKIPGRKKKRLQKGGVGGGDDADKDDDANLVESAPSIGRNFTAAQQLFMEKHRAVSKNWNLPDSFPSSAVFVAYQSPQVDDSQEAFTWGRPDLGALRKICFEGFGWDQSKADELLLPVLKEYDRRETQLRLDSFYSFNQRFAKIRSTRIQKAVSSITGKRPMELMDIPLRESPVAEGCDTEDADDEIHEQTGRKGTRRQRGRKTGTRGKKSAATCRAEVGARKSKATANILQPRTLRSSGKIQASTTVDATEELSSARKDLEPGTPMLMKVWERPQDGSLRAASEFSHGDVNPFCSHPAPVDARLYNEPDNTSGLIDGGRNDAGVCSMEEQSAVAATPVASGAADFTQLEPLQLLDEQPVTDVGLKPVPFLRRKKRART